MYSTRPLNLLQSMCANFCDSERTEQALDTTSYIKAIIKRCPHEDEDLIIGEMQFSYLTGMHLGNSACMVRRIVPVDLVHLQGAGSSGSYSQS